MSIKDIGKRVKSNVDMVMFRRFPLSDNIKTLPAGKPSPIVTSFLANGYYQLEGKPALYLKKTASTKVVSEDSSDDSGFLSGTLFSIQDWITNTKKEISDQSGFLKEGFEKSVSDIQTDFLGIQKALLPVVFGIVAILLLFIINKVVK